MVAGAGEAVGVAEDLAGVVVEAEVLAGLGVAPAAVVELPAAGNILDRSNVFIVGFMGWKCWREKKN